MTFKGWMSLWVSDVIDAVDEHCTQRIDKLERSIKTRLVKLHHLQSEITRLDTSIGLTDYAVEVRLNKIERDIEDIIKHDYIRSNHGIIKATDWYKEEK
jgi:hypothetical protein